MILIAGGSLDPNIHAVIQAAKDNNYKYNVLYTDRHMAFWDINNNTLLASTQKLQFDSVFSRPDVFTYDYYSQVRQRNSAYKWHHMIHTYALTQGHRILNPNHVFQETTKIYNLLKAKEFGFDLPETYVAGGMDLNIIDRTAYITKPVDGGAHAFSLDEVDDPFVNGPAFIQEKLETPDMRIFRVGADLFVAFYLHSPSVDYRERQDATVTYIEDESVYEEYLQPLIKLSDHLGLEYCAVDLKRKQGTEKEFKFLEINTLPMFSEFDKKSEGKIAKGIVDLLYTGTNDGE